MLSRAGGILLTPVGGPDQAPIPPPSYHRTLASSQHLDALTLVTRLELLARRWPTAHLAQRQCPPPLPGWPGGAPRVYTEETLLRLALLRTLWLPVLSGTPRLAACLAGAGAGLRVAAGGGRAAARTERGATDQAAAGGRCSASEMLVVLLVHAGCGAA